MRVRDERLWRHPQNFTIYHDTIATGTIFGQIRIDRTFGDEPFTHHDIRQEFRQRYVNADGQLNKTTQTAYLLALRFGLLPEEHRVATRNSLRLKIEQNDYRLSTGFVGTALLCPVLSDEDMDDRSYALLLQRQNPSWLYSVDRCEKLGISLKTGSEANQCLLSGDFEETAIAKETRKDFRVGNFENIVL